MNYEDLEDEFLEYASIVKLIEGQEMTPAEVSAAITAIQAGIDWVKASPDAKAAHSMRIITSMERELSKLDRELAKLESELAAKERELTAKDKEIFQLKEQLAQSKNKLTIKKIGTHYYSESDSDNPICSACFDLKDKVIRLLETDRVTKQVRRHNYQCPICHTTS